MTPIDGSPQGLLTREGRATAARQESEAIIQPLHQLLDGDRPDLGGRQLDRERDAVQVPADLLDGRGILLGQGKAGEGGGRPLYEECHRLCLSQLLNRHSLTIVPCRGQGERGHAIGDLARQSQWLTARGQHVHPGTASQEDIAQGGARLDQVLAVVQNHHHLLRSEIVREGLAQRAGRLLAYA
jgi:hypothetical protein